jgi:hypothetical protein
MMSLFQTASGSWHWPSILQLAAWLATFAVSGFFLFANLNLTRQERVRVAQVEEQKGPWKLSDAQRQTFSDHLREAPKGNIAIEYTAADQVRSYDFAVRLRELLIAAGYDVWGHMPAFQQSGAAPLIGIQIGIKDQSDVLGGYMQRAFKAIGIDANGARITNNNYPDDYVVIFVGIKP